MLLYTYTMQRYAMLTRHTWVSRHLRDYVQVLSPVHDAANNSLGHPANPNPKIMPENWIQPVIISSVPYPSSSLHQLVNFVSQSALLQQQPPTSPSVYFDL